MTLLGNEGLIEGIYCTRGRWMGKGQWGNSFEHMGVRGTDR